MDSVVQFIEACQLRPYEFTAANSHEVHLLCEEWDIPSLLETVDSFLSDPSNQHNLLIPSILFFHKHDKSICDLEQQLCPEALGNDLMTLSLAILSRVLTCEWNRAEIPRLFEFLM
jgi:hypothetical protein